MLILAALISGGDFWRVGWDGLEGWQRLKGTWAPGFLGSDNTTVGGSGGHL